MIESLIMGDEVNGMDVTSTRWQIEITNEDDGFFLILQVS